MTADEPGPLPRGLLDRLASRPAPGLADLTGARPDPGLLAADLAVLRAGGYLKLALPARFGGAGLNLAELACAQRQLAARAPAAARAVNAHHAWAGAAADALVSGDTTDSGPDGYQRPSWILAEAARGRMFTRDFRAVGRSPRGGPGHREDALNAGRYAWELSLDGMTSYAVARRAFDLAVERASTHPYRPGAAGGHERHPLDRWPVAEAALRLDGIRGQLDQAIAGWRRRVVAGGGLTSLDPGRLSLIGQFTARHVAAEGARRVVELAALIAGDAVPAARA
jgi:alkylation response protein AidB-like acyl-CoA dehydrogenase